MKYGLDTRSLLVYTRKTLTRYVGSRISALCHHSLSTCVNPCFLPHLHHSGHPKTSVSTTEVKESPVDVDTALNKILELRQTVTDQQRQTDISGKLLGSCYNNSDVLSMVSAPFNNSHFYYLSQASRKNISAAQVTS